MPAYMNMNMKLTTPLELIDDSKTASYFKRDNVKSEYLSIIKHFAFGYYKSNPS